MKAGKNLYRLFSLLLCCVMLLMLFPAEAEAAGMPNYLTFTAEQNHSNICLNYKTGSNVQYSLNGGDWTDYTEGDWISLQTIGEFVRFKGTNVVTQTGDHFTMNGKIAAAGDVTSLTNGVGGDIALSERCYANMFAYCDALTTAPALPSTTLAPGCYASMFENCTSLTEPPELPATVLASSCYQAMFDSCYYLKSAPALPATTLGERCYYRMFESCIKLASVPVLQATVLKNHCYEKMFSGCTDIKIYTVGKGETWSIPAAANDSNAQDWNKQMFSSYLAGMDTAPVIGKVYYLAPPEVLGFTSLQADSSVTLKYKSGSDVQYSLNGGDWEEYVNGTPVSLENTGNIVCFKGTDVNTDEDNHFVMTGKIAASGDVTSLTNGTGGNVSLSDYNCYSYMFDGCTALTAAPELPSTVLKEWCYRFMFRGCTSLTDAPELPGAVQMCCYAYMFKDCTGLTRVPELPSTELEMGCYEGMFSGCTNIKLYSIGSGKTWGIPETETSLETETYWNKDMFTGTGGDFTGDPEAGAKYYYTPAECLTFTALEDNSKIIMNYRSSDSSPRISKNGSTWVSYRKEEITLRAGEYISFKGLNVVTDVSCHFIMSGKFKAAGDVTSLTNGVGGDVALSEGCYANMFVNCDALTTAPALPSTTLARGCYARMFYNCSGLRLYSVGSGGTWSIPEEANAAAVQDWNMDMFGGNIGDIDTAPVIGKTYYYDSPPYLTFCAQQNGSGVTFSYISGTDVEYRKNREEWTSCPSGTTVNLENSGDYVFFRGTGVKTDSDNHFEMTGKIAASGDVTSLTNRLGGDAELARYCYQNMFDGCTALTSAPELPSATLAYWCYRDMFKECTSLVSAPKLPATQLEQYCYSHMFEGCVLLADAPELPAISLEPFCYQGMFYGCSALTDAPVLPAVSLKQGCYQSMFYVCTSLKNLPELPATTLAIDCYEAMFLGCKAIKLYKHGYGDAWSIPAEANTEGATDWNKNMFKNTEGDIDIAPPAGTVYYTVQAPPEYLTFTAEQAGSSIVFSYVSGTDVEYLTGGNNWTAYTNGTPITLTNIGDTVCFRGLNVVTDHGNHFIMTGRIAASGDITSLTNAYGCYARLTQGCYAYMFSGCTALTAAPALPAVDLAENCYEGMFSGCTALAVAPVLPAETMADSCYKGMFSGCISLTRAPSLTAVALAPSCYNGMFGGCSGLILSKEGSSDGNTWSIPEGADADEATDWNKDMFKSSGGDIDDSPGIGTVYYYSNDHFYTVSGYVYDYDRNSRQEGITVTAYWIGVNVSDESFWTTAPSDVLYGIKWNAAEYGKNNPAVTDAQGGFCMNVPAGWWRFKCESEGCDPAWSDWVAVQEDRTDISIAVTSNLTEDYALKYIDGTSSSVTVSLTNNTADMKNMSFIIAAYSADGRMLACSCSSEILMKKESLSLTVSYPGGQSPERICAFVLRSGTYVPVREMWSRALVP